MELQYSARLHVHESSPKPADLIAEHQETDLQCCAGVTTETELLSEANTIHPEIYTNQLPDLLSVKAAQPA